MLLGMSLSKEIERRGWVALLTSRNKEKVNSFNSKNQNKMARAYCFDPGSELEVEDFVRLLLEDHPSIDGLVNNAYPYLPHQEIDQVSWATWSQAAVVGLGLPLSLSTALFNSKVGISSIVNISSIYATVSPDFSMYPEDKNPSSIFYGSIKSALLQQTRYLAAYWAKDGVRVNSISPGGVQDNQDSSFLELYNNTVPMGRMIDRKEVSKLICFMLSNDSNGITGQNITIRANIFR